MDHDGKFRALVELLRSLRSVVVAYSGGVDSTFLLKVAHDALGGGARGVLAFSESLDRNEFDAARKLAEDMRVPITVIETREYDNPLYRRNDADRCYHCKKELFVEVKKFAERTGVPHVIEGSHAGDIGDHRPGMRARNEEGVRSPLMEVGITKEEIRRYSRALGLPTWDKPAAPCLSSRLPYGTEVSYDKLRQVEAAEKALRDLGFREARVRHHGAVARLEVPRDRFVHLLDAATLEAAVAAVKQAGFLYVAMDLEGFRSGSLNEGLGETAGSRPLVEMDAPRRRGQASGPS
jgi:uncharacterized protein